MEIPQLLKTAISELDVNLEEELSRYQYWRKHGRAPSTALKFTQRAKPVLPPPIAEPPPIKSPEPIETTPELPTEPDLPLSPPPQPENVKESWFDWQTGFAALVITILLGTVGYIAAEMLSIDRLLEQPPVNQPVPQGQTPPQNQTPKPPVAINPPPSTTAPPVSVRPPLPDPSIENLPPVEASPPPGEPVLEKDQPIVVYKVVVDKQYLDRVQQIEPGAFIRPSDGTVQVAAFENVEDAKLLIETLLEKDIPAQLE